MKPVKCVLVGRGTLEGFQEHNDLGSFREPQGRIKCKLVIVSHLGCGDVDL